jgi:Tol biopolymer transport system component
MSRHLSIATVSLLVLIAALAAVAPADAAFGPIRLLSKIVPEQAEWASAPAVSADGRYVAFEGTLDEGRSGIFKADLETESISRVATGEPLQPVNSTHAKDAPHNPSISADGRYVSFTTKAPLDPVHDTIPNSEDVYVADTSTEPPTYELASAQDNSQDALPGESFASPRVALSASGRRVAFINGRQVYLRDLDTRQTILVSARRNPETGDMEPGVPVPGGAVLDKQAVESRELLVGAAISGDGTTVAWLGAHLPEQVPLLGEEAEKIKALDEKNIEPYDEPLWRRVADGPAAPTRRIIGGGDPVAPGCPTDGKLSEPSCQGPFPGLLKKAPKPPVASGWLDLENIDGTPQLSEDGRTVALIGNPDESANVFLVNMSPGLTRDQATRQLTRQVPINPTDESAVVNQLQYLTLNGHIFDIAMSPDADRIAFTTLRQVFPLSPPNLVTSPPAQVGLAELYLIDLETESLQRLTHGAGGEREASLVPAVTNQQAGVGATSPTLDGDGYVVAFASIASNLVEGDGNDQSDVFAMMDDAGLPVPGSVAIPPAIGRRKVRRRHRLVLSAYSLPHGGVKLIVIAPSRGKLSASARASLVVGRRPKRLAAAHARAKAGRPAKMTLDLRRPYRHLAHTPEGIYATAFVSFHARRGKTLHGRVDVRFRAHSRRRR